MAARPRFAFGRGAPDKSDAGPHRTPKALRAKRRRLTVWDAGSAEVGGLLLAGLSVKAWSLVLVLDFPEVRLV